jgi:hypothetical protein
VGQDKANYRVNPRSKKQPVSRPNNAPDLTIVRSDSNNNGDDTAMIGIEDFSYLARDMREGGHRAISFLLAKAINPAEKLLPDASNMQFRNIKLLSPQLQKEWIDVCHRELEDLQKRHVYELVDLPSDRKAIDNKWVFLIKPDGRK